MSVRLWISSGIACVALACSLEDLFHGSLSTKRPRSLLLLTIDTVRADHVSSNGYARETTPRLDALAGRGIRFSNHAVQQSSTWPSLTSIMTSQYPQQHGVMSNGVKPAEHQPMLADLLREHGFRNAAFVTNMLTADHPGFETVKRFNGPDRDRRATDAAIAWLREHRDERFFLWLHLFGPHEPYDPSPPYRALFPTDYRGPLEADIPTLRRILRQKVALEPTELDHLIALYDGDLAQADAEMGRVLDALASLALEKDTLVVFTSDHGELLYDRHFFFMHSRALHSGVLDVPLVVSLPSVLASGRVVSTVVESIDIAPTVLDLLGLEAPTTMQGRSLLPLLDAAHGGGDPEDAAAVLGDDPASYAILGGAIRAIRTREWLYIKNEMPALPLEFPIAARELYDLGSDPTNRHNVVEAQPAVAARLERRLEAWWKHFRRRPHTGGPRSELDPKTEDELRALGYIED